MTAVPASPSDHVGEGSIIRRALSYEGLQLRGRLFD